MPVNQGATVFQRAWRWAERLASGEDLSRADLDIAADDLAGGVQAAYQAARRKSILFANLPLIGNPFEQVVTENADGSFSLREWRITGWAELQRMQPSGTVTYGAAQSDISGAITAAGDAATLKPIPVASLPATGNPYQFIVTTNAGGTYSLRQWRGAGWVEISRMDESGTLLAGANPYTAL